MRTSIVIVTYNGSRYLEPCISSILNEIQPADEIILVDNASSDESVSFVRAHFPEVRLICNNENRGFAAACNQGAAEAKGDTLVFLNQDTRVCPGWLAGLEVPFDRDRSIGLVTSKLLLMSQPERIQMCGQDIHFTGFAFGHGFLSPSEEYHHPESVGAISGASFAIRRELWEQLGGFDPDLYMYYEETDLCWRARLAGFTSLYNPDSVVYHDYSLIGSPLAYLYSERNRLILLLKNWKWSTLILLLPSLIMAEIIDWGYMIMIGRKGISAKAGAWKWLINNLSSVKRSRDMVQSTRKDPDWALLKTCTFDLTPTLHKGGWMGKVVISICNLLFRLQYQIVFFVLHGINF